MNPERDNQSERGFRMIRLDDKSQFERDLENARAYYGDGFPGNEGLTCLKCGAAVNLGWQHITWHEAQP